MSSAPNVTGDEKFSQWYQRGLRDIRMLLTDIGHGPFPVAGVPWYAVPFGRDSLITALQLLSVDPKVAKGTLLTMASFQGKAVDASRDEQPGKILHEWRVGELTRTGQMPFGPYYGTIDATPLFLILAAEYCLWTGDFELIQSLDDVVRRAFAWIEQYGDRDGDGFVEYFQEASGGIANQGWKDSGDSIVHKDGTLAEAPIALCEVQGYVYKAYQLWSILYARLGNTADAERCRTKAQELQRRFIECFWMEEEGAVALALDKHKNKVASISSNMGQVLWSGILPEDYAVRLANRLLAPDMFSGYGIRTLSALEKAYNPLSYHNGTVWPHDNSLIISGFQRYGLQSAVAETVTGLLRAASHFPLSRLPELFAGYGTAEVNAPVPYPVSCSPQAWAAATPMLALQAMMGLVPDTLTGVIHLNPVLPNNVNELHIAGIRVGNGALDVSLLRSKYGETSVLIKRNTTGMAIQLGTG
jgi:glycogen debranching enzyme